MKMLWLKILCMCLGGLLLVGVSRVRGSTHHRVVHHDWRRSEVMDPNGLYILEWWAKAKEIYFRVTVNTKGFIGLGFSHKTEKMTKADLVLVWVDDRTGEPNVLSSGSSLKAVYLVQRKADFQSKGESAGDKLVVVDFFAAWCGPCKVIRPKLEELANQYGDKVMVLKVDADECEDFDVEYGVSSMPTFVFIRSGEKIDRFVGANAQKLGKSFARHVENSS